MSNARNLANLLGTGTFVPTAKGGTGLTSGFANGITEADEFRWNDSTNSANNVTGTLTTWERNDNSFELIGSGMTVSSGIFSFRNLA